MKTTSTTIVITIVVEHPLDVASHEIDSMVEDVLDAGVLQDSLTDRAADHGEAIRITETSSDYLTTKTTAKKAARARRTP